MAGSTVRTDPDYLIDGWESDDGLPDSHITTIAQTPDGYLWIGTQHGLARFDGVRFGRFDPSNTPQLADNWISRLHVDRSGNLWASTVRGLAVATGSRWRRLGSREGWPEGHACSFADAPDDSILVTTDEGQVRRITAGQAQSLPAPPAEPGLQRPGCVELDGAPWLIHHRLIARWDGTSWTHEIPLPPVQWNEFGWAKARDGGLWLLVRDELRKYRGREEQLRKTLPGFRGDVADVMEDSDGNIWIGTYNAGLWRLEPGGGLRHWLLASGLCDSSVTCIFEDREGDIWVGTNGGLMRFTRRRFRTVDPGVGPLPRAISRVSAGPSGDALIAIGRIGAYRWQTDELTALVLPEPLKNDPLWRAVLADRQGRFWLAAAGRGLWRTDETARSWTRQETVGSTVSALFEDSRGRIWMAGVDTVSVLENGRTRSFGSEQGIGPGSVSCFAEGKDGTIWLTNTHGVFHRESEHFVELRDNADQPLRVNCLLSDSQGAIWMGSRRGGLFVFTRGILRHIVFPSTFPIRGTLGMTEDALGYFWLATDQGIARVARDDLLAMAQGSGSDAGCQMFDARDGLPTTEFAGGVQPARDARGRIWFPTMKGIAIVDPGRLRLNATPPPVRVEKLLYYAAPQAMPTEVVPPDGDDPLTGTAAPISLPPGSRRLEIHYTATSLQIPSKVRFQVTLEGTDTRWQDAADRRVAYYDDLKPGNYVFRVRAANNDGIWNMAGASLRFSLRPFFWQTGWFQLGLSMVLMASGGGITWRVLRLRQRTMRETLLRQEAELELADQRNELTHLSRVTMLGELSGSLAHELNQPLTAILSNAEAAQMFLENERVDLGEIRRILADIVSADKRAGDVIQRLRTLLKKGELERQPLDANEVVQEVLKLVRSSLVNQGVTVEIDVADGLPRIMGDRVQLEQVLINLIMNACDAMVSNPRASRVLRVLTAATPSAAVMISIIDRGVGIPPDQLERVFEPFHTTKAQGMGLGLSVCRTIVSAHEGTISAGNNPERGARFDVILPAAPRESA